MTEVTDGELLKEYYQNSSEQAFAELVDRYQPLVYSVCFRVLKREDLAQDATQATFLVLHKTGKGLKVDRPLGGWIYKTAWRASLWISKDEQRRKKRELKAGGKMEDENSGKEELIWQETQKVLDQGLQGLPDIYRDALVLHFYQKKTFKETGELLGCNEDTAKKRVYRGVEKLKRFFTRKGVGISGILIFSFLSSRWVAAAPAQLTETILSFVINQKGAAAGTGIAVLASKGVQQMVLLSQLKTISALVLTIALFTAGGIQVMNVQAADTAPTQQKEEGKKKKYLEFILKGKLIAKRQIINKTTVIYSYRIQDSTYGLVYLPSHGHKFLKQLEANAGKKVRITVKGVEQKAQDPNAKPSLQVKEITKVELLKKQ